MKVLFLDDSRERCAAFSKKYTGTTIVHDNNSAIFELEKGEFWDAIFLDHDLEDGSVSIETARWIRSHAPEKLGLRSHAGFDVETIFIHTTNIFGARDLISILGGIRECLYVPFDYDTWIMP